jgi:hypothetical protein
MKDILSELFGGEAPPPRASNLTGSSEELLLLRDRNRRIEVRYERLKLVTLAMWELLKRRLGCSDEELRQMITQLDTADGRRDGKMEIQEGLALCASCSRTLLVSAPRCPYCGTDNEDYDPLTAV